MQSGLGKLLPIAKRVTRGRRKNSVHPPVIDKPDTGRLALLICDKLTKATAVKRVEPELVETDTASKSRIKKCVCLDGGLVVQNPLNAKLKPPALIHPRLAFDNVQVLDRDRIAEGNTLSFEIDRVRPIFLVRRLRSVSH